MKNYSKLLILLVLITVSHSSLVNCSYQYEKELGTATKITNTLYDYARGVATRKSSTIYASKVSKEQYNNYTRSTNTKYLAYASCSNGTFTISRKHRWRYTMNQSFEGYRGGWVKPAQWGKYFDGDSQGRMSSTGVSYRYKDSYLNVDFKSASCYKIVSVCPSGYTVSGNTCYKTTTYYQYSCNDGYTRTVDTGSSSTPPNNNCKKQMSYNFYEYTCKNETNNQNFNWIAGSSGLNSCSRSDPSSVNYNTLTSNCNSATPPLNNCSRKYQECEVSCEAPLEYEANSGKCKMSYEKSCELIGQIYNTFTKKCEENNQCGNEEAFKLDGSSKCAMFSSCNTTNGICTEESIKSCTDSTFTYNPDSNYCEKSIACNDNQVLLPNGKCGSIPYCDGLDVLTRTNCINTTEVSKTCAPYDRDSNVCFKTPLGDNKFNIDSFRKLDRVDVSGGFKVTEYGDKKKVFCNNQGGKCGYRLTKLEASNDGKSLCFTDNMGVNSCVTLSGNCLLSGSIEFKDGIRTLRIENSNKSIVAYNKDFQSDPIGKIDSTCTLSGKVGHINTSNYNREIIAAKTNGSDIVFWDSYRRGKIGVITFMPTIPQADTDEGYTYKDADLAKLYVKGFTGFFTENNKTYAVYNGLLSRSQCLEKIENTSFFIAQGESEEELEILNMLSLVGEDKFNYNDGNNSSGSCVVKSTSVASFNNQEYSLKSVEVPNQATQYQCSPLQCKDKSCQYAQCPNGYVGTDIDQAYIEAFRLENYPTTLLEDICVGDYCDTALPYFTECGNVQGCPNIEGVFQQTDGSCVQALCSNGGNYNIDTQKCEKLECIDSVERNGKCYKTLEI